MKVPFMDLRIVDASERAAILASIERVMDHGKFIMGMEVEEFESKMAAFCCRQYAVGVSSGTDALYMALRALGVGPGDEVITTAMSWIATANAIAMTGAEPVFADIDESLNLTVESVERLLGGKTRAIVPVHYTGRAVDIERLTHVAKIAQVPIIYDAAQAFGSTALGRPIGAYGEMTCFSLNPMKTLGALGEAGLIVTDRQDYYETLKALRYNGTVDKEICIHTSLNGRLDALQAAIIMARLTSVEEKIASRKQNSKLYDQLLSGIVELPLKDSPDSSSCYYSYTIRTEERQYLMNYLNDRGIETKILHPILMCDQSPYQECRNDVSPLARAISKQILCLPVNENLSQEDVFFVANTIRAAFD